MNATYRGMKLGRIFVGMGLLDPDQERAALDFASKRGLRFGAACVRMGFLEEATIAQGLAVQAGFPSVSLAGVEVARDVLDRIPKAKAEEHRLVPLQVVQGAGRPTLVVAIADPRNLHAIDEISFMTGARVSTVIAPDRDIDTALNRFYGIEIDRHTRAARMVQLESEEDGLAEADLVEPEVVNDPLRLALDFLPTVTVSR